MPNYWNGLAPIVTAYGPGNLHHLAYASDLGAAGPNTAGKLPAPANTTEDKTHFVVGFSYGYTGYAFYWDGEGPAF
ncbi:hypothetical protein DFH06DRAFT_1172747 [Mycena polygramma]|nr:hypothetical protein DFH06DRAFT_1172747 [Mycena polygramma]